MRIENLVAFKSKELYNNPPYLVSDLGLDLFCLGADFPCPGSSLVRESTVTPPLDCSSTLCLSYSRRNTSDREGGGWNVTGKLTGTGSCFVSDLLPLRRAEVAFFLSVLITNKKGERKVKHLSLEGRDETNTHITKVHFTFSMQNLSSSLHTPNSCEAQM